MTVIERKGRIAAHVSRDYGLVNARLMGGDDQLGPLEREYVPAEQLRGAVQAERERIAYMLARDANSDERGGFDERTRTVLRSYARSIAAGEQ